MTDTLKIGVIVIGRNEGERLVRCLASVDGMADRIVYVDSGSTDGSVGTALNAGAEVIDLDLSIPFTAARARNAGLDAFRSREIPDYVQFIDGDCELQPGWISVASCFLEQNPHAAVAAGRLRERFPEASVYNRICDREWDTPSGKVRACGGIAMMRMPALDQVGGFNPSLIAGEEPELCVRLRRNGWEIWRIEAEMALHDAAMSRFSQWWKRMRRSGHAAAEGMALHGAPPEYHGVATVRRALLWGLALPATILLGAAATPWATFLLVAYPLQIIRLALRSGNHREDWEEALFLTIGKFPEVVGILEFWGRHITRRPTAAIEYK